MLSSSGQRDVFSRDNNYFSDLNNDYFDCDGNDNIDNLLSDILNVHKWELV